MPQAANSMYKTPRRAGLSVPLPALPSGMQAMTPGTVPCVVSEGHDTAGLSPVSWRENAKVRYGNFALRANICALFAWKMPRCASRFPVTRRRIVAVYRLDTLGAVDSLLWAFLG